MRTRLLFALLLAGCAVAAQSTTLPFEYYQSLLFVRVTVAGQKNLRFLVNTGANASVIDTRTADRLKLSAFEHDTVVGTVGREAVALLRVPELRIGTLVARSLPLTRRDLSAYLTPDNSRLDGVLGTDFLARYAVTIDYVRKRLTFQQPTAVKVLRRQIPFTLTDGTPVVVARLNDTLDGPLYFNSGVRLAPDAAIYFNISETLWRDLKKATPRLAPARYLTVRGVGGSAYLPVIPGQALDVGPYRVQEPNLVVQPDGGYFQPGVRAGFFGNNFLEKFQKVTLDFSRRVFAFDPPKSYGAFIYEREKPASASVTRKRRAKR